jgi:hypothetical protein
MKATTRLGTEIDDLAVRDLPALTMAILGILAVATAIALTALYPMIGVVFLVVFVVVVYVTVLILPHCTEQ